MKNICKNIDFSVDNIKQMLYNINCKEHTTTKEANTMATNEIITKLNELAELRKIADDLNAEIEAIQNEIKAHMTEADTDTITAGPYKVSWKAVTSTRIDTTALRKDLPEIWQEYGKTSTTRRFNVAVAN